MFADDALIMSDNKDPVLASVTLKRDLTTISNYFLQHNLVLNTKKTKGMNFSRRDSGSIDFPVIHLSA